MSLFPRVDITKDDRLFPSRILMVLLSFEISDSLDSLL